MTKKAFSPSPELVQQSTQSESSIPSTQIILDWLEKSDVLGADWMTYPNNPDSPDNPREDFLGYQLEDIPNIIQSALRKWGNNIQSSKSKDNDLK